MIYAVECLKYAAKCLKYAVEYLKYAAECFKLLAAYFQIYGSLFEIHCLNFGTLYHIYLFYYFEDQIYKLFGTVDFEFGTKHSAAYFGTIGQLFKTIF